MATSTPVFTDSWSLLNEKTKNVQTIITFCETLDQVLGGGIHLGRVTELVGPAGIGKTQFCMQLAVDVQLPKPFAGVDGGAVFIDTECCYKPKRLEQIAKAAVAHVNEIASSPELKAAAERFTLESILDRIYVNRCYDLPSLTKTIEDLSRFIRCRPMVKLVIVDSLAYHFRDDQLSMSEWRRLLQRTILALNRLASERKIAVLVVNHMTTRFTDDGDGYDEPALNEILTRNVGDQIMLGWKKRKRNKFADSLDVDRCAVLYKSSHRARALTLFQICLEANWMGSSWDIIRKQVNLANLAAPYALTIYVCVMD